jgi:hypothetical protein
MDVKRPRIAGWIAVSCLSAGIGLVGLEACGQGKPASPRLDTSPDDAGTDAPYLGCPDAGDPTCPSTEPSWKGQVQSIADAKCATCHFPGAPSGLNFSTPAGFLHDRTTSESDILSCNMPPSDAPPLSPADWETLLEWLACGAPDN